MLQEVAKQGAEIQCPRQYHATPSMTWLPKRTQIHCTGHQKCDPVAHQWNPLGFHAISTWHYQSNRSNVVEFHCIGHQRCDPVTCPGHSVQYNDTNHPNWYRDTELYYCGCHVTGSHSYTCYFITIHASMLSLLLNQVFLMWCLRLRGLLNPILWYHSMHIFFVWKTPN